MKASKHGKKYMITYRCSGYPKPINECFSSEEEAELRIAQIKLLKKQKKLVPPTQVLDPERDRELYRQKITVAMLLDEYVRLYGLNHWSEGTLSCNLHRIKHYIVPYIGDALVKDLTTHQLEQFYQDLMSKPAVKLKGREDEDNTVSFSVVERVHTILRSALNQAIRWDYLRGANPAMAVELPRHKKQQRDAWTDQEARYALEVCTDPILKLCMYLALGCSMRIGEILGLTWDCIHIEQEQIEEDESYLFVNKELRRCYKNCIEDLKNQGRDDVFFIFPPLKAAQSTTALVLKTPKTESSVRNIYIPATVAAALVETKKHQSEMKSLWGEAYQDYNIVVAQDNGRPFEEHMIMDKLRELIAKNNLKPVVFHSLRHSSTSLKLRISGGDIKAVQGDTGHAQANMVTDVYAHIMNDDRKRLARKMDEQFFTAKGKQEAPAPPAKPPVNTTVIQLMALLQSSPEITEPLLQMSKILGNVKAN